MTVDAATAATINLPAAAIEQGDLVAGDLGLLAGARLRHDRIRWWWGERIIEGANGAYCYLCDRLVATWQRSRPTTRQAVAAILAHRDEHLAGRAHPPGTSTDGTIPPGDAPTAGGQQ